MSIPLTCTPDVTVKVNPERGDLVETRVIDGVRYILIRAEEGVQVNGIDIHISDVYKRQAPTRRVTPPSIDH